MKTSYDFGHDNWIRIYYYEYLSILQRKGKRNRERKEKEREKKEKTKEREREKEARIIVENNDH